VTRYEPRNLDAMRRLIVGFPDDMRVEAGPDVPDPVATAKTVAELHSLRIWPPRLVLVVQHGRDPRFRFIKVERN
jgi:hypothetical protein